ncbi:MAG: hypothetical protein JSV56_03735 [Methanomassiliicoccales archaeon]|nr:MAG: hypothetical protein JSV56_03735 [Methanomassiliicoccales archaeon]
MKKKILGILTCILMVASSIVLAGTTAAHWDEEQGDTHKMHWAQTPDTSDTGVGVHLASWYKLGDDFKCTQTGYINDIHLWGAFKNDNPGPYGLDFRLHIYSDKPAVIDPEFPSPSRPKDLLWYEEVLEGEYTVDETTYPDQMDWYYPNTANFIPDTHTKVYQYNFHFEDDVAFQQQEETIYWLVVLQKNDPHFGWMTTTNVLHWNDNAVRPIVGWPFWEALEHPNGDPMDLAFVINGTASSWTPPLLLLPWDLYPLKLNGNGGSNGRSVMAKIDPPEGYDKDDIDVSTLMLEDSIPVSHPPEPGKIGHGKGNNKLMLKFDRGELEDILTPGTHNLKISGLLVDGTPFVGYSNPVTIWDEPPNLPP